MLDRIAEGRTDLIFDYVAEGNPTSHRRRRKGNWKPLFDARTQGEVDPREVHQIEHDVRLGHWRLG